jgi:biotin carboxyl carrier protein
VDVLGVRQEVVAADDGVLTALEAQPGEAVEYGQPVARIERVEQRS